MYRISSYHVAHGGFSRPFMAMEIIIGVYFYDCYYGITLTLHECKFPCTGPFSWFVIPWELGFVTLMSCKGRSGI